MTYFPNTIKKTVFIFTIFVNILSLIYSKFLSNEPQSINFQSESKEKSTKSLFESLIINLNRNIQKIIPKYDVFTTQSVNITEHTVNSMLFMAQRAFPMSFTAKNDSSLPLPINIDTSSLSLIIPELSTKYPKNRNMTVTIYEDTSSCVVPQISMAIDGVYLDFDIGMKMGVFNEESSLYDEILDVVISAHIKSTIYTQDNKLNIFMMKIIVQDLNIKNNVLILDKEVLKTKFTGFFSLIIDQTRKMITKIDVLKSLNEFSGLNFTSFDLMAMVDCIILTIQ